MNSSLGSVGPVLYGTVAIVTSLKMQIVNRRFAFRELLSLPLMLRLTAGPSSPQKALQASYCALSVSYRIR